MEELQRKIYDGENSQLTPFQKINIDLTLQKLLSEANIAIGRLNGNIELTQNLDLYSFMFVLKEARFSCLIDNTVVPFCDVLKKYLNIYDIGLSQNVHYVLNYSSGLTGTCALLKEEPLSLDLIKKTHKNLLMGVKNGDANPGEFRKSIGLNESFVKSSNAYVHPPNQQLLQGLKQFEQFMANCTEIPALIAVALIHAYFVQMKPFLTDNGKLGRMLILFYLYKTNLLKQPILGISEFLYRNKEQYFNLLSTFHQPEGKEAWVKYFLEAFIRSTEKTISILKTLQRIKEHDYSLISELGRSFAKGRVVLNHLFKTPLVRIKDIEEVTTLKNPNALVLVSKLTDMKILFEITGQKRNRIFAYKNYINLFLN